MATDVRQTHFRFGKEELLEATHGWWQNEDVNHSQLITADWAFLLRFVEQEAGGTAAANTDAQFQYNKNGAGWVNITTTSSVVKAVASVAFTNGQACTKRLSGTGTFETTGAGCTEDGSSGGTANDIAASGNSETEAGLQIVFADVANGDTIQFRFTSPDWTITYTVTPTLTIQVAVNITITLTVVMPATGVATTPTLDLISNPTITLVAAMASVGGFNTPISELSATVPYVMEASASASEPTLSLSSVIELITEMQSLAEVVEPSLAISLAMILAENMQAESGIEEPTLSLSSVLGLLDVMLATGDFIEPTLEITGGGVKAMRGWWK